MSNSRVFVNGIPPGTEVRDLERFFKGFGRLNEVSIKGSCAFIKFDDSRDAEDAIYEMNGKQLLGEFLIVEKADNKKKYRDRRPSSRLKYGYPVRTKYRLIVKNLSYAATWKNLKNFMRKAGEVTYAFAHKPFKNEGIVEFASYDDMRAAIRKLDGAWFKGEEIRLIENMKSDRDWYDFSSGPSRRSRSSSSSRLRSTRSRSSRSRISSGTRSPSRSRSHSPRPIRSTKRSISGSPTERAQNPNHSPRSDRRSRSRSKYHQDRQRSRSRSLDSRTRSPPSNSSMTD